MATVISDVLKSMIIVVLFSIISPFDDYVTWDTSPTRTYTIKLAYFMVALTSQGVRKWSGLTMGVEAALP
jgi:hypothetical protein